MPRRDGIPEGGVVHPDNTLNEMGGEAWLYFTKSLWTTAYPSELGHAARKAHGANKPPRLMARLIEFFTKGGELVLDPFAGVGGTLLGAAICRAPRRALGFELEPRWAAIYEQVVREALGERDGAGPRLADLGSADQAGRAASTRADAGWRWVTRHGCSTASATRPSTSLPATRPTTRSSA